MFRVMRTFKKLKRPVVAVSLLALGGLLWAAARGPSRQTLVTLTSTEGAPVVVKGAMVHTIHEAPYREASGQRVVRLLVLGLAKPVDVLESLTEVLARLGGDWVHLQGLGSWFGLADSTIPVLIDRNRVVAVDRSGFRRNRDVEQLTDIEMEGGYKLRVVEPISVVCHQLGV